MTTNTKLQTLPHHVCGSPVHVLPTEGGRGTGDMIAYGARCDKCGFISNYLGTSGKASAIRHHNRLQKQKAPDDKK